MKGNTNQKTSVKSAQVEQLYASGKISLFSSILLSLILAYVQKEVIASFTVYSWLLFAFFIAVVRFWLIYAYQHRQLESLNSGRIWLSRYRLGVMFNGLTWGAASFFMFTEHDMQHQMFLMFMLAGISAGGIVALSADLISSAIFLVLILIPIASRQFMSGESLSIAMGMAAVLYLAYMLLSSRNINKTLTDNIVLRLESLAREDALRLNEERYRLLLNHSPVGIFHYDANLSITYCNKRLANMVKTPVKKVVGFDISNLMNKEIHSLMIDTLNGNVNQYEGEYKTLRGKTRLWIGMTCAPARDTADNTVGGIAIVRDISKQKRVEEMLRIGAIAFETQTAMLVTTSSFIILRVNQAFARLSGYSTEELIGKTPQLFSSDQHDRAFYNSIFTTLKKSGNWQGEVWNRRKSGLVDPEWVSISAVVSPEGKTSHYVMSFSDVSENKDAMAEIHRLAYYDPLTQLPNRRLLRDRLNQELANAAQSKFFGAILFLDLDSFKALNDARGHNAGDQLLIEVAQRLRAEVRRNDIVGRLGGDEFVVIMANLSKNIEQATSISQQMGEKLLALIAKPFDIDGYEFFCSTSIGIRLFREQESVDELLRHADLAMYEAKAGGRNTFRFFNPTMQISVTSRANMEKDIRTALEQNEFVLYFQSQEISNRKIIGAEILLRWLHPRRGLIMPAEFIEIAEKNNLILQIGQWVIEAACAQLKAWEKNQSTRFLQLGVNVSARQFRQPDFVDKVIEAIEKHQIKPDLLNFELTESLVIDNISDTITKMHELRKIGVRFSLDDFGTGYSSLSYLTQLPLDQLKIDQSFVHNINADSKDSIVIQTIIGMAHNLGIDVIAEGVENDIQRIFLESHGCPAYQGYVFSKPVPIEQFEKLVMDRDLKPNFASKAL